MIIFYNHLIYKTLFFTNYTIKTRIVFQNTFFVQKNRLIYISKQRDNK